MESSLRHALRWGLLSLLAAVPLAVFYRTLYPAQIKDVVWIGVMAFVAMGWLYEALGEEKNRLCLSPLGAVLLVNLVIWVASMLLGAYPNEGLPVLGRRLAGVGMVLLVPLLLGNRRDLKIAVGLLTLTSAVMSLYGLVQFLRLDPFLKTDGMVGHFRVASTATHPNIFISFLVACIPLNIAAFKLLEVRRRGQVLLSVALVLNLLCALATLSRAGLGALVVALAFLAAGALWLSRLQRRQTEGHGPSQGLRVAAVVVIGLLVVGGVIASQARLDPGERQRLLSLSGPTIQKRLLVYEAALKMGLDAPVLGKGLGSFSLYLPHYRSPELGRYFPRNEYQVENAVSEPFEIFAESGFLGLAAWLLLVGMFVVRPLRWLPKVTEPGLQWLLLATTAGVIGLLAHGLAEVALRFQPPLFMFWTLPALALAALRASGIEERALAEREVTGWSWRLGLSVFTGMTFGLIFAMTLSDFVANYHVTTGRRALEKKDYTEAEQAFARAVGTWSGNLPGRYRHAFTLWQLGHLAQAEAEYREVLRRSPYYFDTNHNLARVLHAQGKTDEAARFAAQATHLNPYHLPSHGLAIDLALRRGAVAQAEKLALHMRRVGEDQPLPHAKLIRVRLAQKRPDVARTLLDKALVRFPDDPNLRALQRELDRER